MTNAEGKLTTEGGSTVKHIEAADFNATELASKAVLGVIDMHMRRRGGEIFWLVDNVFHDTCARPVWYPTIVIFEDGMMRHYSMATVQAERLADEFDRLLKTDAVRHSNACHKYCQLYRDGLRSVVQEIAEFTAVAAVLETLH